MFSIIIKLAYSLSGKELTVASSCSSEPFKTVIDQKKRKGTGAFMQISCNYFKELYVDKVIQLTELGLVGGSTVRSLCNAAFAIQLFNVGRLTEW